MRLWLPVIAYMAGLFGASSFSTLPSPPGEFSDYHMHFVAYAGLAVTVARALSGGRLRNVGWRVVCGAIAISALYGVTDEYHQLFVPGRTADVLDLAADAVGSVVGAGATGAWGIIRARSQARHVL